LRHPDIRGVVLASPAPFHFSMAKAALEAGKDVFVEKPICLDDTEAAQLCEIADQGGNILMVGHLLHYHPVFMRLKQLVQSGALGRLRYIYSNRLSLGKIRREENVLWSFAPHDVSMILGLADEGLPSYINASGSCQTHPAIEDFATLEMRFASGAAAHITVSWLNPFKEQKLIVIGDQGMAIFDDQADWPQKLMHYPHIIDFSGQSPDIQKSDGIAIDVAYSEPLRNECQHFIDCIQSREKPRTDGYEGLNVLKVLIRADQAIQQRKAA
jgi:UDP-2-acetamido-3-amino-2,3-dideoxy-glucuronate N-acetyltransferase